MSISCCAPKCENVFPTATGIKFHRFPANPERRLSWSKCIQKYDPRFRALPESVICSAHFCPEDYEQKGAEKLLAQGIPLSGLRIIKTLKPSVCPHVFPGLSPVRDSVSPVPESSPTVEQTPSPEPTKVALFKSIEDIVERLQSDPVPSGFSTMLEENCITLCHISRAKPLVPELLGSITIRPNLTFSVVCGGKTLPSTWFRHLIGRKILRFKELVNLMNLLKEKAQHENDEPDLNVRHNKLLETAVDCLNKYVNENSDNPEAEEIVPKVKFLLEQLRLIPSAKQGRRYSDDTLMLAHTLYAHSTKLYASIREQGILSLPTDRRLMSLLKELDSLEFEQQEEEVDSTAVEVDEEQEAGPAVKRVKIS